MSVFRGAPSTVTRPDLFPRSAEQAAVLKQVRAGSLWTDPDFSPTDASLHGKGKPRPPSMAAVVAWLRPDEFAPLPAGSTHALIVGDAAAGDVVQGALGDCYLLGALSTVAASRHKGRSRLLQLVMPADGVSHEDPPEGKAQGAYTFRFYIFGEWVQVTVDTLIPCGADRRPVFARCHDERELWALYLEKAYAKLHGSYRAIEGGSLTAALVDLTGGFAAEIDLRTPATAAELESGRLWQRLMRYQKLGYLMGAAVSVPGGETEAKTEHNLMQNHAYGLLLHYEQKLGAVPGVPLRLVKLRNPWGHGEWNGAWADGSAEWRSAPGEYAAEQLDYTPENDGTFFIEFTQYARAMNTVYVCKVLPDDEWHRSVISDGWAASAGTAGGCFNFPTWRVNPQWQLRLDVASHAHFVMLQPDARVPHDAARGARASPPAAASQAQEHAIGLYVMRGHERFLRRVLVNSDEIDGEEIVDSTAFVAAREVSCNTLDEEGELPLAPGVPYVLVPSTFLPGADGQFKVVIYTHTPPATLEKIPPLLCAQAHGAWRGPTAGGPRDRLSWKRNPQFFVHARSAQPTRISIVLHREDLSAHRLDEGAKGSRRAAPSEPQSPAADARVGGGPHEQPAPRSAARFGSEIGFVVAYAESSSAALSGHRALHVRKADLVDTAQYAPEPEVACEFLLKEAGSLVVVPSTSAPGMEGDFGLSVYSDQPVELATVEEWRRVEAAGEWKGRSAGGCRNTKAWVANPIYALQADARARGSGADGAIVCHVFVSQPLPDEPARGIRSAPAEGDDSTEAAEAALAAARAHDGAGPVEHEGIGLYVLKDNGGELSEAGVAGGAGGVSGGLVTSGFYTAEEVGKELELAPGDRYLLIPSTYRKGVERAFRIEVYAEAPVELRRLKPAEHAKLADGPYRGYAAEVVQKAWARYQIRRSLGERDRGRALELAHTWFAKPYRDSDEGFRDLNFAINALEAAFIQLTGEPDAHGKFFPRMRNRLNARGIKVSDYDMCLPGPQED
ncbi:hypothetical protein KFE25_014008 [Diacronema lutheri]|uniref:Calpain catalytic domain-containing protein n=1 Tax=Diacronema lutheri TaxID=2081491 RepID=A0A8J5XK63_DIALT|nr:hypothetical protein KFE25_014008 [Diacronema lutheri]